MPACHVSLLNRQPALSVRKQTIVDLCQVFQADLQRGSLQNICSEHEQCPHLHGYDPITLWNTVGTSRLGTSNSMRQVTRMLASMSLKSMSNEGTYKWIWLPQGLRHHSLCRIICSSRESVCFQLLKQKSRLSKHAGSLWCSKYHSLSTWQLPKFLTMVPLFCHNWAYSI